MKVAVMIPTRLAASRFPRKPLVQIMGMPMIEHVYRRAALAIDPKNVFIATCDEEIKTVCEGFGAKVIMTSDQHVRCTDRIAEAAKGLDFDVIVNVQGDEPVLDPACIDLLLKPFRTNSECVASNLIKRLDLKIDDPHNYNSVKVTFNKDLEALYFSREAIPTVRKNPDVPRTYFKQTGIMAFSASFLQTFTKLSPTPLEAAESVDMLRMLEHGYKLQLVESESKFLAIDVPEDLKPVEDALAIDPVFKKYKK
jgi:3-deoxy-manno-octulosonate cytidylyltransferase (CMP-KDO synthetase)